ncbi:MAG: DUF3822 family protein [Prolixibacteraceae bacterium]|nr:DUF3822 family protein [Prolixibacteraceae bacterium]
MNIVRFIDDSFESTNCSRYSLSIQCSLNGFSFLITHHDEKKHLVLASYRFNAVTPFQFCNEANTIIADEPLLKQSFLKVNIGWNCTREMLCPVSLSGQEEIEPLYKATFETNREDLIQQNILPNNETAVIFSIPRLLKSFFEDHFPNSRFFSTTTALLRNITSNKNEPDRLIVSQNNTDMCIAVVRNHKIMFLNHFYTKTDTDCMYYILYTARQFMLPATTPVEISGTVGKKSELAVNLKSRFPNLLWKKYNNAYSVSYKFLADPEHLHYPITQLALCE